MKIKYLTILFLFLCNLTYAQKYVFIDKDPRIIKHEPDVVKFLIKEGDFGVVEKPFKMSDYAFLFTIKKRLEIYGQDQKAILLIKFSSFGDHTHEYYGLLTEKDEFLFHSIDDTEFIRFCKVINNPKIVEVIRSYLTEYPADEYHGHQFTMEKNTPDTGTRVRHVPNK